MEGWLLDCYPSREGGMTFWLKEEGGKVVKLRDSHWFGRIYASGVSCDDASYTFSRIEKFGLVREIRRVKKRTDVFSEKKSSALEIELEDASNAKKTAEQFEKIFQNPDTFRLYNVDVLPEQQYFHQNELFPLARVKVSAENGEARRWELLDNVESLTYETPNLRCIKLDVQFEDRIPKLDSRFHSISLSSFTTEEHDSLPKPTVVIHGSDEAQMLVELSREVDSVDPDIIVTRNGDSFLLPYLYAKSRKHSVNLEKLNRDTAMEDAACRKISGTSYFQYGKILYSPSMQRLYGRLHLDEENTFVYDQCRLQGLYEVARLCRIPLQKAMRASIGKCLSGLQFYHAFKDDLLIPWKPDIVEDGKNGYELFTADRGGLVFNPLPGVHKEVGELDFASLYPSIIRNYNISAETVNCVCCPDSPFRVEELKMRICWRRSGIVAKSLDLPIRKRFAYKKLRDTTSNTFLKNAYSERASALKWILVCCLEKESPVLVLRNGIVEYVKIGIFIEGIVGEKEGVIDCPAGISVAGIGCDLKSKFCKVKKLIKVPNQQKLLNITLDDGRKIVATPNHPFYLLKNGNLEVRQAVDLKEGNFIPIAKKLPSSVQNEGFIDVIDELTKSLDNTELGRWRVSGSILSQILLENKQTILEESMKHGYSNQAIRVWIRMGMVPLRFFGLLKIPLELRKSLRVGIGRVKGKFGRTSWLPAVIPINEELGFFLGLYASDGSTTNTYIRLDIGYFETDLLENICKIVESLFQTIPRIYKETNVNMFVVQINNLALVRFIEQILDIPNTAEKGKLKVPRIAFNSDKTTVAQGFLEGMLAGDGSMSKSRAFANIATASRDFANQIGFLAATLNLGFRLAKHTRTRFPFNPLYSVNFVGPETLKTISQWKYLKRAHLAILGPKIDNLCNENGNLNCTHPSYQLFPTDESGIVLLARQARTVRTPRIDQRDSACPYRIAQTINRITTSDKLGEKSLVSFMNVKLMFQSDLGFARIRKIEVLDRIDDHVYCFQLEDDEVPGFFTGEGAVFSHNCFGYLSYRNAKFGKIDSHMAVCALARKTLFEAMRISEYRGFKMIHGIIDSLWLEKNGANFEEYNELCSEIYSATGFNIAVENIYKWIVFLPSKTYSENQVANRYFGCSKITNEVKVRGIESRRHDTPSYFKRCQLELLGKLAKCNDESELRDCARKSGVDIFEKYARGLEERDVPATELLIRRRLSKDIDNYRSSRQLSVNAGSKLQSEGRKLQAGQSVCYLITRYKTKSINRALPEEFLSSNNVEYDSQRYVELLADCCSTILSPFGTTKRILLSRCKPFF